MIQRTYNIPLRSGFRNTARYKKTKKAVTTLKEFLMQHMKSDKILIGANLNKYLWKHGIKNPPHHVKVSVIKEDDGTVKAELLGFKYEHMNKAEKEAAQDKKEKKKEEKAKKDEEKQKKKEDKKTGTEEKKETPEVEEKKGEVPIETPGAPVEEKKETPKPKTRKKKASKTAEK